MPAPIMALEVAQRRLYKVGRSGFDSGTADSGGAFTAILKSEKIAPKGMFALCHFRRIGIRILRTAGFTVTAKAYVDGVQTQIYSAGSLINQSVVFTKTAPATVPERTLLEMDINQPGSYIELEITAQSDQVSGVFLPEEINVHYRAIRESRERGAGQTS